jgi:hypothetical protein
MRTRSYSHYNDPDLLGHLKVLVANERSATAELVAASPRSKGGICS